MTDTASSTPPDPTPPETTPTATNPPVPTPTATTPPGRASARARTVRMLHRLHFYAGVAVAPFLLVAAVTGALYAVSPSVEKAVYGHQLHTDSTGTPLSVADQIAAAQRLEPDLTVTAVRPPARAGDTTQVLFDDPALGASERRAVFVDPVTGDRLGDLVVYGSSNALPLRHWIDRLHRDLHLGEPGRLYSEFAASWLWVIVLAGLGLWFARTRAARRRRGVGRARTVHRHAVIGVWIAAGLLFLSATGLTWSTYAGANVTDLRSALDWTAPALDTGASTAHADHGGHATPVGDTSGAIGRVDAALALARSAGLDSGVEVTLPADARSAYTVTEVRAPFQFSPDSVAVDPASDRVTAENRFADWPIAARLANLGIALHMGLLFGVANQIVLLVLAAALVAVIVLGYRAWWRRPGRRAPARGAMRSAPLPVVVGLVAVAAAVGAFVPLLGWPLLAFVLVDAAVAAIGPRTRAWRGRRT